MRFPNWDCDVEYNATLISHLGLIRKVTIKVILCHAYKNKCAGVCKMLPLI